MAEQLRATDDPKTGGVKFDAGKLRLDLVPIEGVRAVADILTGGAKKYGDRNWEKGMDWSRPYVACLRHLFAWWDGEKVDAILAFATDPEIVKSPAATKAVLAEALVQSLTTKDLRRAQEILGRIRDSLEHARRELPPPIDSHRVFCPGSVATA